MDEIKTMYKMIMTSNDGEVSIAEVIVPEDDDIYSMGRLFKQYLLALTYDEDTIKEILKLENL